MSFTVKTNLRCLRGLHLVFSLDREFDLMSLVSRLLTKLGPTAIHDTEAWPGRVVHTLVVPFRLELRLGERDREVSLLHRHSSSPAQRASDRALLEQILSQDPCPYT